MSVQALSVPADRSTGFDRNAWRGPGLRPFLLLMPSLFFLALFTYWSILQSVRQ